MRDLAGQLLMPWGAEEEQAANAAVSREVPKHAATCNVLQAAAALHCCERTVRNMIDEGTLLARYVGAVADPQRKHWRIVVRDEREADPARRKMLTLDEAVKVFTNIGG
jgi:hypothetical protein